MRWVHSIAVLLTLTALFGCGPEPDDEVPATDSTPPTAETTYTAEEAVIRYFGFPSPVKAPMGGFTTLDPETGLPTTSEGCIIIPGIAERVLEHNEEIRAACARGELREFQLKHKFTTRGDLHDRFRKQQGALLAPGSDVETVDGTYRLEVRLERDSYWQGYLHANGEPARRFGDAGERDQEWRVLFDHDDTTVLLKKGDDAFEVCDLPTRNVIQSFHPQ